jgi:alginate O-acetyltransferase complex protein AlgI
MLFNSISFAIFYIVVTLSFFVLPHRYRWFLLLAASIYFYMAFIPAYIVILALTIVIDYYAGIAIDKNVGARRKALLVASIVVNVAILCLFKYYNFFASNLNFTITGTNQGPLPFLKWILPIGLSFHTFQALSYIIEVYRGNQKPERNFGIYSLYIMFYPQLVAGPIERPQNMLPQMHKKHVINYENFEKGLGLMLWGFFKKIVVADRLSIYVSSVYDSPSIHNGTTIVLASLFFAIQIYCDFSGYTDIAIGCAKTMGFDLVLNFRRPYFARSIREFWNRWHMSLSTWFRDYLYIPLGGNRVSKLRQSLNLMIVFLVSGFWHGANWTFIIWGGLHGFYLIINNLLRPRMPAVIKDGNNALVNFIMILFNLLLVTFAWIFFRANSLHDAWIIIKDLKTFGARPYLGDNFTNFGYSICAILLLLIAELKMEYFAGRFMLFGNKRIYVRWATAMALIFCIILFGVIGGGQFIYFQF